jgi:hypothetical protein
LCDANFPAVPANSERSDVNSQRSHATNAPMVRRQVQEVGRVPDVWSWKAPTGVRCLRMTTSHRREGSSSSPSAWYHRECR